ncbi:MAG: hypothetical protein SGBAC_007356 [Bacillariaceae sp.]
MLKLQRKSMLNGRSPTQKPMRKTSGDSITEGSSSFSFRDDNEFSDWTFESPRRVLHAPIDSMYTDDQVVLQPDERERPRVGIHSRVDGLERFSVASDPSGKKKKKKKHRESHEEGKGKSKPKKSSPKAASDKTKKKRPAKNSTDSPFWSLMGTGQQLLSVNGTMPNLHNTGNSEPSDGFREPHLRDDQSFVSSDGSILLPSKSSMEAKEYRSLSPKDGGRRTRRTKVNTATGTILMPSKASLERTGSMNSNKASKKKRRPKPSNDLQSPTGVQKDLDSFMRENASAELSPSSVSYSRSQSSKASRKSKDKKAASTDAFRESKSVSPKPAANTTTSLSPAIEGKQSSFTGMQHNSFLDCDETAEENNKSKMIQPSKASLESMLERVTIRKKTRKSSASSVGSKLRGKRPKSKDVCSDDSVISLDTGMSSRKANQTNSVRQDSLSAENSAAVSVGSRKNRRPVVSKELPSRASSYQCEVVEPVNHSPVSVDGASMRRSKASLQKVLEKRDSVKSRNTSASSVGSRRSEKPLQQASPSSPKSILKVSHRNSFGNDAWEHTEPRVVVERRASVSTNSKQLSAHALASFRENISNEEKAIPSDPPKRRGVNSVSLKVVKSKTSPTTKGRNQRSRSLSPMAKGNQAPTVKFDLADDPWDNIDEAFMPITSAKREEQMKKVVEETKQQSGLPVKTPDDMWKSLACLDTGNCSPNTQPTQRQQQLKATEVLDAWWNVEEDHDQSQATRKKKLAQKSILLVSSNNIPSTTSGSKLYSPPSSAAAATKTPMHASMPMPSLDSSARTTPSPSSSKQRQSEPALPSMGNKSLFSPANTKPQRQSEPKRAEVVDAWWATEDDKQSVAKEAKKKQLARKSVLLVGNSSISSLLSGRSFDFSDDEEEIEEAGAQDDGRGRRVHSSGGRRTASQSPGRLARNNNRRMVVKQPSPKERSLWC